jgi:hypothetical protein
MMSITPYSCPPSAANYLWINNVNLPSSSLAFSNFNFPPYAPTWSRNRNYIVLASADDEKQRRKAARGIETDPLEMLELKFGHLLGENPQKTFAKVLGRKSNPNASYLEIEKSMKGKNDLHLKRPLQSSSTEGKEQPLTNVSNGQSVSSNTEGNRKSLSLIRPVMRREGKRVISPIDPTRLGSDAKAIHMESDSKEVTHKVLLRRPSKQTHELLGFADQPTAPHLHSRKKEDSVKRNIEDTGLLRRPEAIRFDYNLRKSPGDSKAEEVVTENLLGSKTDRSNTYAAAEKRRKSKRENRISLNRPTLPMNPLVLTSYEMDSKESHGSMENENRLKRNVSESRKDGSSFPSREPKSIGGSVPSSAKSDKMSKADIDIPSLIATPPAKTQVQ